MATRAWLILTGAVQFIGVVAGFSGSDEIDLLDIAYVASGGSATTLSWTQLTSAPGANGTMTVAKCGSTANITPLGWRGTSASRATAKAAPWSPIRRSRTNRIRNPLVLNTVRSLTA